MFPQLPAAVRVFLCTQPTDMRKSFDGLLGMAREYLGQDPLSGHLFLFLNRRRDRVKILFWERDGLVIWYKRPAPIANQGKPASNSPRRTWPCSSPAST
jgi:transposase